jgi:hypothetical protein
VAGRPRTDVLLILRESDRCDEGIEYYRSTNQRVRVAITDDLIAEAEAAVANAWKTAPLVDSPKVRVVR